MVNQEGLFNGFSVKTPDFLINLKANNNKSWFESNRRQYQELLLDPFRKLADDMGAFMLSIDPLLEIRPGRAISRIYRDTRFARDKSPYKTTMWITYKRPVKNWQGCEKTLTKNKRSSTHDCDTALGRIG